MVINPECSEVGGGIHLFRELVYYSSFNLSLNVRKGTISQRVEYALWAAGPGAGYEEALCINFYFLFMCLCSKYITFILI